MEKTVFKKIIDGELPAKIVYEDKHHLAFLDINPIANGHILVIPKEEAENIFELSDESAKILLPVIKKVSIAVKKATNADGINIIANNGAASGQIIFHLHFHIIPRFSKDTVGGWAKTKYSSDDEAIDIQTKIKDSLDNI